MPISLKDIVSVGTSALSWISSSRKKQEQEAFEAGKQLFLMELLTHFRQGKGSAIRPTPGSMQFAYCEVLVRDGIMARDIISGVYWIKSYDSEMNRC
jgi:hypothetical protein